jgi:S1-C subfamily serine protease
MPRIGPWLGLLALLCPAVAGQEPQPLTNDDIVGLIKAGISSAVVAAKIAASPSRFDTSPVALQELKAAGVPDEVVVTMLQASTPPTPAVRGARVKDEMTSHFRRLQDAVLTIWSETGHGSGFVIDQKGLILTNHHVIGPSRYIAVQFDPMRKIPAVLLESDPLRDVAVLWADISMIPEAIAAPLAASSPGVEEGERVFTIGSPLNQRKILTSGVASKLETRAILSDININPGNSGGPLFNSLGEVVGITTFHDPGSGGPGVSGIVRIEEALPLIERAHGQMPNRQPPPREWLPVEPADPFPLEAIKAAAQVEKFNIKPYTFGAGDYDMGVLTPILLYRKGTGEREAIKSKEKRTKQTDEAFDPSAHLYNWAEYVGEYRPVVTVRATPKLRETFWSAFGRGLAAAGGSYYLGPANMKFKTDFLRMELLCGQKRIAPILPAKIAHVIDIRSPYVHATDATYEGLYTYPIDAFAPRCGTVTLRLYSEKDPAEATVKVLDQKTVDRVWADFEGWRQRESAAAAFTQPPPPASAVLQHPRPEPPAPTTPVTLPPGSGPSQGATEGGTLQLLVVPWAEVEVDGAKVGTSPLKPLSLPPGVHAIKFTHPDYLPFPRKVTIRPGETTQLQLDLTKEAFPR